jgi:hypothetical protein
MAAIAPTGHSYKEVGRYRVSLEIALSLSCAVQHVSVMVQLIYLLEVVNSIC